MMDAERMNDHDLMVELVKSQRVAARNQKIMMGTMLGVFLVVLISAVLLVPRTLGLVGDLHATVKKADGMLTEAQESLALIDEMTNNLNTTITDNSENLSQAVEKMNNVDFDTLNRAINDLSDTVEPLANFFNRFK